MSWQGEKSGTVTREMYSRPMHVTGPVLRVTQRGFHSKLTVLESFSLPVGQDRCWRVANILGWGLYHNGLQCVLKLLSFHLPRF